MDPDDNDLLRPVARSSGPMAWLQWYGTGRVLTICVVVCTVVLGGWWVLRPTPLPVETRIPLAATRASTTTSTPSGTGVAHGTSVVVDIVGAVLRPGLYHVADGARVDDLVRLAGGSTGDADLERVNTARRVVDGEQVVIPRKGDPVETSSEPATFPVHLNSATESDLDRLPGVGPATAAAIIAFRSQHGPFTSVDQLAQVRGIGAAKLDAIRQMVAV